MYEYPFKSHYLNVSGHRLHYLDEGKGDVLLMLHGNPTWSYFWRKLVSHFRSDYRIIVPDHIGCGLSDKPQKYPYRLDTHIQNLTVLIKSLNLDNVTLLVHDWGGAIGMGWAVEHLTKLKRFILFNTAAFRSSSIPLRIACCKLPIFGKIAIRGFNAFAKGATYMACETTMEPSTRNAFLLPYDNYKNRIATHEFVRDIPMRPKHPSWERLKQIEQKLPLLQHYPKSIIWGQKDWCFHPGFLKEWNRLYPDAETHIIQNAGHYLLEDSSPEVIPIVEQFLQNTESIK